ncbi:Peptidoglycan/LPS O-acetylase OafA/YrhL, contains acyltransferase and SGNH-hydrolase domains [Hydrocarboniphaga daqingensis]|uniref:Peptidoglycan/LPS O-acetylase OafA/YrhL, contains acyltransferase and SGNH-hydrolase domains n=1 Tax=Hydrocarboniphaga daqingensis TaxID=490188 RepID=A0A1M5PAX4_9GAMM|nr:acyltransferase [Hydrocarboniphaga daqingensis]SHG98837.1 Peptidoglycan/LPS O-acetylase OafA/YrhL, contains acyltransferase and SGNH-hydrolase domains [Hydrocarboniphaga daqingensis]
MPRTEPRPMSRGQVIADTAPIASLDGIRALAVLLVVFAHSGLERIVPGGLGVTVFFVLSGFLITTLMQREYAARGALQLGAFYLRRLLRLMPPLLVVVALAAMLSSLTWIDGRFSTQGLLSLLFYLGNYQVIFADFGGMPAGIGVVWSLAVEEHFYLLYPPLAVVLLGTQQRRTVVLVLLSLCLLVLGWRCVLYALGASQAYLSMATDTRADAILVGCLMAFWSNPATTAPPPRNDRRDRAMAFACVSLLLLTLMVRNDAFRQTLRYSLQSLAIAPLIHLAVARATQAPYRMLSARPLVYLGGVSYTIYLSHQMILDGLHAQWPTLAWAPRLGLGLILTLALAELMRRAVEAPCAELRRQLHRRAVLPTAAAADAGEAASTR